jgi:hypothetical protein
MRPGPGGSVGATGLNRNKGNLINLLEDPMPAPAIPAPISLRGHNNYAWNPPTLNNLQSKLYIQHELCAVGHFVVVDLWRLAGTSHYDWEGTFGSFGNHGISIGNGQYWTATLSIPRL